MEEEIDSVDKQDFMKELLGQMGVVRLFLSGILFILFIQALGTWQSYSDENRERSLNRINTNLEKISRQLEAEGMDSYRVQGLSGHSMKDVMKDARDSLKKIEGATVKKHY